MRSEYVYPELGDRRTPDDWQAAGAPSIRAGAKAKARDILARHYPAHIDAATDAALRARLPLRLAPLWLQRGGAANRTGRIRPASSRREMLASGAGRLGTTAGWPK